MAEDVPATSKGNAMCHTLIIEDEYLLAELMGEWAQEAGAQSLDFAPSEDEAVKTAVANPPAFIISDVMLTQGTGPRAVARITALLGPIPTMFVTGTPEACHPCDDAVAIISKPTSSAEIAAAFKAHAPV